MTKSCVFVGPTLHHSRIPFEIDVFGPATLGSIYRAVQHGYKRIGLVDGLFGDVPSVWHKEVLFAMDKGTEVYGAASMGALRAAELHQYGMVGVGRIYNLFRLRILEDDDEVAVTHSPPQLGNIPLSEALVNIRATVRKMRYAGIISRAEQNEICVRMKNSFFADRTIQNLRDTMNFVLQKRVPTNVIERHYVDLKSVDALQLCDRMCSDANGGKQSRLWSFPSTLFWSTQFEKMLADVPDLQLTKRS